jgi:hypothetical protein
MNNLSTSQLLVCCYVNLNLKNLFTFLQQQDIGQLLAFASLIRFYVQTKGTWQLLVVEDSPLNRL